MMLMWKIRFLDQTDREFKDRCLYLDTNTLDAVTRAAVEFVAHNKTSKTEQGIFKFRHLFIEDKSGNGPPGNTAEWGSCRSVGPSEYFEDETGKEITGDEMAQIWTANPTARLIPSGAKQHDIELMFSERKPIPVAEISLSAEDIRLLGYFGRDLHEMQTAAFMKDRPATIKWSGSIEFSPNSTPILETSATDEEIRSFVTIFRRLYMEKEPANFQKAVAVFGKALGDHPYAKWASGVAQSLQNQLRAVAETPAFMRQLGSITFTTKRLIDVFLYTQYAHQPAEARQRQFGECLAQVSGNRAVLTWMFLTEIWKSSLQIGNAGKFITWWFKLYCDHHVVSPDVLSSLRDDHAGLGAAEKEVDRRARLLGEKIEQVAMDLWNQARRPDGGPSQFLRTAREELIRRLEDNPPNAPA
jgi:hypothetical protein